MQFIYQIYLNINVQMYIFQNFLFKINNTYNLFQASVLLEQNWSGNIFAKSGECQYEKCNTPHTTAELKFGKSNGEDHYKVSIKEGFNRPITVSLHFLNISHLIDIIKNKIY